MCKMDRFVLGMPMSGRRMNSLFNEIFDEDMKGLLSPEKSTNAMNILMGNLKSDIKETETSYIVETELPGFDKKDINVEVEDGVLTISAETAKDTEDKSEKYIRKERYVGKYSRSFTFEGIDSETVKAKYDKGILIVELPKIQKSVSKKGINID